jgi:hypothetical protein
LSGKNTTKIFRVSNYDWRFAGFAGFSKRMFQTLFLSFNTIFFREAFSKAPQLGFHYFY